METIKQLLSKFIAGDLTKEERAMLRSALSQLSDETWKNVLSEAWEAYHADAQQLGDSDELLRKLQIRQPARRVVWSWKTLARVAAALFIPLLAGASVYLYRENDRLTSFMDKQVAVQVKSGDKAEVTLPDSSTVYLNAASLLTYPSDYGMDNRSVFLDGEAYLKVTKNAALPFLVNTDYMQIEVLGTEFNLSAHTDLETVETTLISGSIKLTTKGENPQTVILSPNEKAVYNKQHNRLTVTKTDPYFETAWLRGELLFRSARFSDIIYKLQQRYDVSITIAGNKFSRELFTGSFKEDNVYGVLRYLQVHYDFTYMATTDKKIEIRFK
jgi:ferric-dicitrate binding protein FerR (iron transport regulator)